jgi:hypothetical protein
MSARLDLIEFYTKPPDNLAEKTARLREALSVWEREAQDCLIRLLAEAEERHRYAGDEDGPWAA